MNKEAFGTYIASKRREKNMAQKELANLLNVSVSTVSKWERGNNYPDITICESLSKILNITLSELFTQTTDSSNCNDLVNEN